ncbi:General alpha-glucoside permease [Escovopsis weberi]|uniref:General alpha-glucoside permease n=1 Tax=Escovopsis weberi TaxID=150374 RepID=A0A0M8MRR9_ESCWE|nr:General alpha-glucoside permease [Escovopsis weberi]
MGSKSNGKLPKGQGPDVERIETVHFKQDGILVDIRHEHELTVRQVFIRHPALVLWSFYWAMAGVGWGFDAQVNGGMLSVESFRRDFGYTFHGRPVLPASWQSAFNNPALLLGLLLATGGIFGEIFSVSPAAFVVSKLILGAGLGFYLTLGPLATSEIAPVVFRGISTAGVQFGLGAGQLLSNAVIKGFETPWYLARVGKREEAKKSLKKLYGSEIDIDAKLSTLEATIAEEEAAQSEHLSFVQCFRGTNLLRTTISTGIFVCQHFTGIIFVLGFSTYFFELAGLPTDKSFDLGVGVTACLLLGMMTSWFTVNTFGRRTIFLAGIFTLDAVLLLIGVMDVIPTDGAKWAQAALTVIYGFVYAASIGTMAFAILGEVNSPSLRAPTIALATATQAIMGIIFNTVIPYMVNPDEGNLKGKVGFIFGGLGALAGVWSYFRIPELRGRTHSEIDFMFRMKVAPRKMGDFAR